MTQHMWLTWGVPAAALLFGAVAYFSGWLAAHNFDRKYGGDKQRPNAAAE